MLNKHSGGLYGKRYRQREWRLGMWGRGPILSGALSDVDLTLQAKENLGRL